MKISLDACYCFFFLMYQLNFTVQKNIEKTKNNLNRKLYNFFFLLSATKAFHCGLKKGHGIPNQLQIL
jgi:hypothetical protein